MVADKVEVFTKSMNPDAVGYEWKSDGYIKNFLLLYRQVYLIRSIVFRTNVYEISECDNVERGTKIVMHLKSDCREYASEDVVRKVINKYSNFVNSPIKLNGSEINTIQVRKTFYNVHFFIYLII